MSYSGVLHMIWGKWDLFLYTDPDFFLFYLFACLALSGSRSCKPAQNVPSNLTQAYMKEYPLFPSPPFILLHSTSFLFCFVLFFFSYLLNCFDICPPGCWREATQACQDGQCVSQAYFCFQSFYKGKEAHFRKTNLEWKGVTIMILIVLKNNAIQRHVIS